MSLLEVTGLAVGVDDTPILRGVNLVVNEGETVALMGPNGSGKSTLAQVLAGHPGYDVTKGQVTYLGQDLLSLKPEERAQAGLFLAWQYPQTVAGVTLGNFLRLAYNATHEKQLAPAAFVAVLKAQLDVLQLPHGFMQRSLNEGFSGGEKKQAEMLQLLVLQPRLVILDETDSGLDVDALRVVGEALAAQRNRRPEMAALLITHHQRILDYVAADRVAVMRAGRIVAEGGTQLLAQIEQEGYAAFKNKEE